MDPCVKSRFLSISSSHDWGQKAGNAAQPFTKRETGSKPIFWFSERKPKVEQEAVPRGWVNVGNEWAQNRAWAQKKDAAEERGPLRRQSAERSAH
jgi:hypothetical protein